MPDLKARYEGVLQRIEQAAMHAERHPEDVNLVVVTKNHPADLVLELIELGARDFGENRDQEAGPKAAEVAAESQVAARWHFVGQLQSNKAKSALSYSTFLHSLDRPSLLQAINKLELANPVEAFIELNLTDDPNRGGIQLNQLHAFAEQVLTSKNLKLIGVMGVAALDRDPSFDFETIAKASRQLQILAPEAKYISAGMSHDFEQAIEFGSTHVRIGTAITGNRPS